MSALGGVIAVFRCVTFRRCDPIPFLTPLPASASSEFPLVAGPILTRELTIRPRRRQFYVARAMYVLVLLLLMCTAWLVVTGTQYIRDVGDSARFGMAWFQIAAPLQALVGFFAAAVIAAGSVCQEKDRRTLDLLLMTELTNRELVLGKLLGSLVTFFSMLTAGIPVFMLSALLGGISERQILLSFAVTAAGVLLGGAVGTLAAFWREKTFQALAVTIMALVLWLAVGEITAVGLLGRSWAGIDCRVWAVVFSPWQAVLEACRPVPDKSLSIFGLPPLAGFGLFSVAVFAIIAGIAVVQVRTWNLVPDALRRRLRPAELKALVDGLPAATQSSAQAATPAATHATPQDSLHATVQAATQVAAQASAVPAAAVEGPESHAASDWVSKWELRGRSNAVSEGLEADASPPVASASSAAANADTPSTPLARKSKVRHVWDNPVLWREVCTWAYGRKVLLVKGAYWTLFAAVAAALTLFQRPDAGFAILPAAVLVPLFLLSLILVNTQAVTSLTTERDAGTLDLILVSQVTPKEFIFGKLLGTLYNVKEVVLLPLLLCGYLYWQGRISAENCFYLILGLGVLYAFAAMLGLHSGLTYPSSRNAIAASLGTVFFLFIGVAVCMRVMLAFSGSFQAQLHPFLAFMIGGGAGLYLALGARNPSNAIAVASFVCPLATFYALTSLFLGQTHLAFLAITGAYGFATAAMLIPAVDEFDLATGRTSLDET